MHFSTLGCVSFCCFSQDITEGKDTDAEGASPPTDNSELCKETLSNLDALTEFKVAGSVEVCFGPFDHLLYFSLILI